EANHFDALDAAAIAAQHAEPEPAEIELLAAPRQAAQLVHDEPADRVVFLIAQVSCKEVVEVLYSDQRQHVVPSLALFLNERGGLGIVLVVDVADDLLEDVLDRREAGHAPVLVDDDGDMVVALPELRQQRVQTLALGNEHGGPQEFLEIDRAEVLAE